jgi:hypothetical protein
MPQDTPNRMYTYPCFSDANDFPAQVQEFAEDVDADVQAIVDDIDDARNTPPSVRASGTAAVALVSTVPAVVTFTTEEYDNAAIFTAPGTAFTIPTEGMYLLSARVLFTPGGAGERQVEIQVGAGIARGHMIRQADTGFNTTVNCHVLSFVPAGTVLQVVVVANVAGISYTTRTFSATRLTGTTLL